MNMKESEARTYKTLYGHIERHPGFSPYSLVYGSDAVSLVELLIPSARVALINDVEWDANA